MKTVILLCLTIALSYGKRPNIIFLMSDDQNVDSMGAYGNTDVKTPHIDALSDAGVTFDNHYATTAICMGSRANVMTGQYEYKNGCNFDHGNMAQSTWDQSYPMLLRKAGYATAFAGKFGFEISTEPGGKGLPLPAEDFDKWGGAHGQTSYRTSKNRSMKHYAEKYPHSTLSYGAFSQDFINEASAGDQPFCLSISFKAPHKPATPDPQFDEIYQGITFKKPKNYGRKYSEHFSKQSKQGRQYDRFFEWNYADKFDEVMAIYHQQIYAIDQAVGMIREAVKTNEIEENTIIIYTSDNGFFCGAHGYGSKVLPYEEGSRVPLIIFDPRNPNPGIRSNALTANIDFAPTILELAELPIPTQMDGKSLVNVTKNPEAKVHDSLALINVWGPAPTHSFAVVTPEHKYIFWNYAAKGFELTEELYDLENDPLETVNLAVLDESKELLVNYRALYDTHLHHWKDNAVSYNNYQQYATIFDRQARWEDKAGLYIKTKHPHKVK